MLASVTVTLTNPSVTILVSPTVKLDALPMVTEAVLFFNPSTSTVTSFCAVELAPITQVATPVVNKETPAKAAMPPTKYFLFIDFNTCFIFINPFL